MTLDDERSILAKRARGRPIGPLTIVLLVIGAAMVALSAIIHLYLWGKADGYRNVPTVGPMFLAQGIAGCLLAVAVAVVIEQRFIVAFAGAVYMAASIAALFKSIHGGLFDFNETFDAPYVKLSLVVEIIGLAAFVAAMVLLVRGARPIIPP
jgi:hypothetical protein